MDKEFKIGDVVQLKSGGVKMTIGGESHDLPGYWSCYWNSEDGTPHHFSFPAVVLKKAGAKG